jgi:hypothetical protein
MQERTNRTGPASVAVSRGIVAALLAGGEAMEYLRLLGVLSALLLVVSCSPASAAPPESWQDYDSLAALQEDADLVVTGVAQRQTGSEEAPVVQFSVTEIHAGESLARDPVLVRLDSEAPLELHAGSQYVLYLAAASDGAYVVVGPGAFERPPGSSKFERLADAPSSLPDTITPADVDPG